MAYQMAWLSVDSALQWLNTKKGTGLATTPATAPVFLLSRDPVETFTARVAGRHYIATEKLPNCYERTNTFAPADKDASPNSLETTDDGRLLVRWKPSVPETIYPALDTSAETQLGPVQSFALWIGEFSATHDSMGNYSRDKLEIAKRYAKGPILFITGTVGPKGSGADLELEDIENWRPGRPIYLPGDELDLPFQAIRAFDEGVPAKGLQLDGPHGNIAVPGLNGLTNASFSASANSADAHQAFNGWQGLRQTRASADPLEREADWTADSPYIGRDSEGWRLTDHWLQVDFGKVVSGLSGLGIRAAPYNSFGRAEYGMYSPRRYRLQTSLDGEVFEDAFSDTISDAGTYLKVFPEVLEARYVRFVFETLQSQEGHSRYWIRVCVAEIYQAHGSV